MKNNYSLIDEIYYKLFSENEIIDQKYNYVLLNSFSGKSYECTVGDDSLYFRLNGEPIRDNGPSKLFISGKKEYWIDHKEYKENEYWNHPNIITHNKLCWPCNIKFDNLLDLVNHFKINHKNRLVINHIYELLLK